MTHTDRRWFVPRLAVLALGWLLPLACAWGDLPAGGNWPAWRGDGSGISADTNLPVAWDRTHHVLWRAPLPGEGSSSPIVWGSRAFVTASTNTGRARLLLCLDTQNGQILWQREMPAALVPKTDPKGGYAPATPATDGQRVYAFFDSPGLVAFDMDGKPLWTCPLGPFKTPYNVAASPVVFRDRVIQCCDHFGDAFIVAADAATGRVLWRTPRSKLGMQFATPLLIETRGGPQVIASASTVKAYDPLTGNEVWSCGGLSGTVAPSPLFAGGLVYATSGRSGPSLAIDPNGRGDVKETHLRMQVPTGGPYVPSPLYHGGLILPDDDGVVRLVDAHGVVTVLARLRAHFTASPVLGGHTLYWTAESGDTYALDAGRLNDAQPALPIVAVNPLGEKCLASPAIAGGRLYVRTAQALYALAGNEPVPPAAATGRTAAATGVTFEALKHRFQAHLAADGDDIPIRLAVVDALAVLPNTNAVPYLKTVALKDPHWDVSEAAAKAVAARHDAAAVPALLEIFGSSRPFLKTIAAEGLGRLRAPEAVPALLKGATHADPLVRIASLQALAASVGAPGIDTAPILATLTAGLADRDGTVRAASIRSLAHLAHTPGADRDRIARALQALAADPNPWVAAALSEARKNADLPPANPGAR